MDVLCTSSDLALFICSSSGQISEFSLWDDKEGTGRQQIVSEIRMETRKKVNCTRKSTFIFIRNLHINLKDFVY